MPLALRTENLGKKYKIPSGKFWAIRNINLELEHGDTLGLIGPNGSGKSTLLKLLSRVTWPSEGRIELYGRIGALLEVGTGFHMDLTGRENIFLSGAILGMGRSQIKRHFDEIIAFSGVDDFLDMPVKKYSSGMFLRLAFAVMAHLDSEILIVDEILAVGDRAFQNQCLEKMQALANAGKTVIFVSHEMEKVEALCSRVLLLKEGELSHIGPTEAVLKNYREIHV